MQCEDGMSTMTGLASKVMSSATVANREDGRDSFSARIQTKYCGSTKTNHCCSRKLDAN